MNIEKIKRIVSVIITAVIICTTPNMAFAANKTIHIPKLNSGYKRLLAKRSGNYYTVRAVCHSAWKNDDTSKNVQAIRFDLQNKDKITMFNKEIVLRVGAAAGTYSIKDSMLKYKDVYFCFCTNSPAYTADTNVGYNPR